MRIPKKYIAYDGTLFDYRIDVIRYQSEKNREVNRSERSRIRDERIRRKERESSERRQAAYLRRTRIQREREEEKERISLEKRQIKENNLKNKLINAFGEQINPLIHLIVKNKNTMKQILTSRI